MMKLGNIKVTKGSFQNRKSVIVAVATVILIGLVTINFLVPAFGAVEEVLNGDGSLDSSVNVNAWTLNNVTGQSTWALDNAEHYAGAGAGKIQSPLGADIPFESYAFYRFTTGKVPVTAQLDLAYKKQSLNSQPVEGNWIVAAEVWEAGGTTPLQTVDLDTGIADVGWTSIQQVDLTSITKPFTQYELRIIQKGQTGNDPQASLVTWFDEIKLNIDYDSSPPQVMSAAAVTDHTVDVVFNEALDQTSAETIANYMSIPSLGISDAAIQTDGKTVRLTTDTQVIGTDYTLSLNNIKDISGNVMSATGTVNFTGIDTTSPRLLSATPVTDNTVDIKFNERVDPTTARLIDHYSIDEGMAVTQGELQPDGQTVRLRTTGQSLGRVYTVAVSGVADSSGNLINDSERAQFTGIDTTSPEVVSAIPTDDSTINVVFNEKINAASAQDVTRYSLSPALTVNEASVLADGLTVQLKTAKQSWQGHYTVTVTNIEDLSGNVINGNNVAEFSGLDTTGPKMISVTAVDDRTVDLLFNENIDASSAQTVENYSVSPGLSIDRAVIQEDGKTVRLNTETQAYLTTYRVKTSGVRDLAGNLIVTGNDGSFIGVDTSEPKMLSAVSVNYNTVNVTFSEVLKSLPAQTIGNYVITGGITVKKAVLQPDGVTVQLTTSAQSAGKIYIITVNEIQDLRGNIIGSTNSETFAGISPPVTTAPEVLSASAPNNATVILTFSGTMDPLSTQNPLNYSISPVLAVTGAVLQKDGTTVRLSTAVQTGGEIYTVTVSSLEDNYGNTTGDTGNAAVFTGNRTETTDPHGRYLNDTNQCAQCHATHNGKGAGLINQSDQTQLCYLCHDAGGQSKYDVADQFGESSSKSASHHRIPEGTQQCSDCHNPHDGGQDASGNSIHWTRLLQSAADSNSHGGNSFCFSCHQDAQGNTKPIKPEDYPGEGIGHNNASFVINGSTPFNPSSGTDIRCMGCHDQHGSSQEKLLKTDPTKDSDPITADDKQLCYKCHASESADKRYAGQSVFDDPKLNPHSLTSSSRTNVDYPGVTGQAGQCVNCHNPHGSAYGTSKVGMKTVRGPYSDGKSDYSAADFSLCFGCHNNTSSNPSYDVQTPYNAEQGGHIIKSSGGSLLPGSKMPCEACHSLHGSSGNKFMLNSALGDNLGDGRNECLSCHQNGKVVEGINMSPPSAGISGHTETGTRCLDCHGSAHSPSIR